MSGNTPIKKEEGGKKMRETICGRKVRSFLRDWYKANWGKK